MESQETGLQEVDSIRWESRNVERKGQQEFDIRKAGSKVAGITETDGSRSQVLDPAAAYNMKNARRGLALIFNHEWFLRKNKKERAGTTADRDNLHRRLAEFGFEVRCYDDLGKTEMCETINDAARSDHSDADCFLCVFLTHGEDDFIFTSDEEIEIKTLTSAFKGDKCKSLAGKPKIFIFQACQGDDYEEGVLASDSIASALPSPNDNKVEVDAVSLYTLPAGADFIMCYSAAEGYYSYRDKRLGSWYILDLCEALKKHGRELEFTELLTLVNGMMSMRFEGKSQDPNDEKQQVPCFVSMLTKKLYLRPKN